MLPNGPRDPVGSGPGARTAELARRWPRAVAIDAVLPIALLFAADIAADVGLASWTRVTFAGLLVAGFVVMAALDHERAWVWAAAVPLALRPAWALIPPPAMPPGLAACGDPASPIALWRVVEAALLLGALGAAGSAVGADAASLSLRWPSRRVLAVALAGPFVAAPLALVLGPPLARPFFGSFALETGMLGAIVPALILALANGVLEEVAYRGALMSWSERIVGPTAALWIQAVAFGLGHGGRDFVASPLPVMAALVLAGAGAGLIVRRTGSLLLPIAIHAAVDIPLYYYQACRIG